MKPINEWMIFQMVINHSTFPIDVTELKVTYQSKEDMHVYYIQEVMDGIKYGIRFIIRDDMTTHSKQIALLEVNRKIIELHKHEP